MTDSKRQSTGSRASTPKPGNKGLSSGPGEFDLSKAIGARVKLTLSNSALLEGVLFTACPITNVVAINVAPNSSAPSNQPGDYHIIPVARIQSFTVLSTSDGYSIESENAQFNISRLDLKAVKRREEDAVKKLKEEEEIKKIGISKEGVEIYKALEKSYPIRWHEKSIVVNDAVIIAPPYRPDDCQAPKDRQVQLPRIKKVLENERRKIAEKSTTGPAKSTVLPVAIPKKGG